MAVFDKFLIPQHAKEVTIAGQVFKVVPPSGLDEANAYAPGVSSPESACRLVHACVLDHGLTLDEIRQQVPSYLIQQLFRAINSHNKAVSGLSPDDDEDADPN